VFSDQGVQSLKQQVGTKERTNCIFEYIYFARPDSVLDKISVHAARKRAGAVLYERDTYDADAVIGVPDSGLDAAMGYSEAATRAGKKQIPYNLGFIKNKYIGRTFISPGQDNRVSQVHIKLNPIEEEVRGKRIILVDDSIVRGTTCAQIVKLLRDAGAKEIHMRISSPPFMNPCYYGTDVDSRENLIACKHSVEEIAEIIGADSLMYLPLEALPVLCGHDQICTACFSGKYPTRIPTDTRKDRFEMPLSQSEKGAKGKGQQE
jgi:amidophosphoribosyltransferase